MGTRLLYGDELWEVLRDLTDRAGKAYVAVAYVGKGAFSRLPLAKGSVLVVDASEEAVKAGHTHPGALRDYIDNGVDVYRVQGLHAKV